jgi:hypothetical protein
MNALSYLIQVNIYLLLFYGLYLLMLRNETFFKMNRLYLVGSTLLAIAIPLVKAEWIKELFVNEQIYEATQKANSTLNEVVTTGPSASVAGYLAPSDEISNALSLNTADVFWIAYASVTGILLLNFFWKLYLVKRAINRGAKSQAFSFFNKVVVDKQLKGNETILDHEMVHVKQWHSLDVIFFELFTAFNWFNPIAFAYKKAIKNIHEFIADEIAADKLNDKAEYALLLVSNVFGTQTQKLTNSFYSESMLKRRLVMLNKNKSRKVAILKYGFSVPLFAIMIIFSSATIEKSETIKAIAANMDSNIPEVLEALNNGAIPAEIKDVLFEEPVIEKRPVTTDAQDLAKPVDSISLPLVHKYFARSVKYPAVDQEDWKVGTTFLTFELDDAGVLHNPSVVQAMSDISRAEVLRVLKNVEPFGVGMKGKYILGIKYVLNLEQGGDFQKTTDKFDLSNYQGYTKLTEIKIRGYQKRSNELKEPIDIVRRHFAYTIKYPVNTPKDITRSTTFLSFELDDNGQIINHQIIKSTGTSFEKEVIKSINEAKAFGKGLKGKYIIRLAFLYGFEDTDSFNVKQEDYKEFKFLKTVIFTGYSEESKPDILLTKGEYNYTLTGRIDNVKSYPVIEKAKEKYRIE